MLRRQYHKERQEQFYNKVIDKLRIDFAVHNRTWNEFFEFINQACDENPTHTDTYLRQLCNKIGHQINNMNHTPDTIIAYLQGMLTTESNRISNDIKNFQDVSIKSYSKDRVRQSSLKYKKPNELINQYASDIKQKYHNYITNLPLLLPFNIIDIRITGYNFPHAGGNMYCVMYDPLSEKTFIGVSGGSEDDKERDIKHWVPLKYRDAILKYRSSVYPEENRFGIGCAEIHCLIQLAEERHNNHRVAPDPENPYSGVFSKALRSDKKIENACTNCGKWMPVLGIRAFKT
jgi:hypothetical protein